MDRRADGLVPHSTSSDGRTPFLQLKLDVCHLSAQGQGRLQVSEVLRNSGLGIIPVTKVIIAQGGWDLVLGRHIKHVILLR